LYSFLNYNIFLSEFVLNSNRRIYIIYYQLQNMDTNSKSNNKLGPLFKKTLTLIQEFGESFPEYSEHFVYRDLKKGEFLLKEGSVCNYYWYVKEGLFRNFYYKDSKEIITFFGYPGTILTSNQSFVLREPCKDNIQAITDAIVYSINREAYSKLYEKSPAIQEIERSLNELYIMWLEERLNLIQFCTAQERYHNLMQHEPFLINQIPVTYLASYLGITLETLSRIRSKYK